MVVLQELWWFFKKKTLWNTHYPTFAAFRAAIHAFFANLGQWQDELASLLTNRFHLISKEPKQIPAA